MCGIVGFVGDGDRTTISKMLQITSHRGPDDSGIYINKNVGLGNNRLAVIDLSRKGHQPMFDGEKSISIVYNGEIYNFLQIKEELKKYYHFKSDSDTEVILYAYKKWGTNCLDHLNGMFAFVIYDIKKNLLFGARDRLGEKPFKYYWDKKNFIFASELKAILSVLKTKPKMDFKAINDYLTLQYVPAPLTGFENIFKLAPGHFFILKDGKLTINKYWEIDYSKKFQFSEDEWIEVLEKKIEESIKARMISDVPVGSFLSGGIDSSTVTAFMAKNSSKRIKTFSVGFNDPVFDETKYAGEVAKIYHTDHSSIKITAKLFGDELQNIVDYYDEPFADNSLIPSLFLSRLARKDVTVALSGDGGDENFAGYDRYSIVYLNNLYEKLPKVFRDLAIKLAINTLYGLTPSTFTSRLKTFVNTFDYKFYKRYLYYMSFMNDIDKRFILRKYENDTFSIFKDNYNTKLDLVDNALNIDICSYLPEDLLYKMDTASMSASLEVRAPLLDYQLMELSAQMPSEYKVNMFNKKIIFKKMLLKKKLLTENIINRPKRGFNAPIKKWLKNDLKGFVMEELASKKFRDSGLFNNKNLDIYINNYYTGNLNYGNNIFALLTLSLWINKYF